MIGERPAGMYGGGDGGTLTLTTAAATAAPGTGF
jgi:hypothetical protein